MAAHTVNNVKRQDTKDFLAMVADEAEYIYRRLDSDDMGFYISDNTLYIGNTPIAEDYSIIDDIKKHSNTEITFFCEDRRAVTTILNAFGERFVNTTAIDVWEHYATANKIYFSQNAIIAGVRYFGYYKPLMDNSQKIVGMVFAGITAERIEATVKQMQYRILMACVFICILALFATIFATGRQQQKLSIILKFLSELDKENFSHEMPKKLTKRKDEYGELSRRIENLNNSLKVLVQYDGLTMLFNRRTSMNHVQEYFGIANNTDGETFTFAIGDIDFFKKINDTYGHNCGDDVLKFVSRIFERKMKDLGFAGRWGGEEFVLVFKGHINPARKTVEEIADEIRKGHVEFEGKKVSITMTFGIAEYTPPGKLDALISHADGLLYRGKENGRNQVVG